MISIDKNSPTGIAVASHDLLIFDVDDTLVHPKSASKFRKKPSDWEFYPGRFDILQACKQLRSFKIALATNQGGAAFGYFAPSDMRKELELLARMVGADDLKVCFTHPKGTVRGLTMQDDRRKPGPGMLLELMRDLKTSPAKTIMIGDRGEDREAARMATCDFMFADEFFVRSVLQPD
jgi:HAD superfamily hydrolase (TIGR01662 family)